LLNEDYRTVSSPFIIWTMQRTGGTTLTDLLMSMSEHPGAEHEPFNWARKQPRQFWPITVSGRGFRAGLSHQTLP
jgi:hypothetical protein